MKPRFLILLAAFCMMIASPAFAMDLHAARHAGLVGEKTDGYVAVLKKSDDVQAMVNDINAKRKQEYAKIAATSNQPVAIVAKLAAPRIIEKLDDGDMYQAEDGSWTAK